MPEDGEEAENERYDHSQYGRGSLKYDVTICDVIKKKDFCATFCFYRTGRGHACECAKSPIAFAATISIMRAFVQVRQYLLTTASMSSELKELRAKVDLLAMQQEENLAAVNDLSEDVRQFPSLRI